MGQVSTPAYSWALVQMVLIFVQWAIRSLVGPIPAVLLMAGILLAAFYPLTRERHTDLREELARRRAVA